MARGAPERESGASAFKKGDIFARIGDASTPVNNDLQGLQFVCAAREYHSVAAPRASIENNLPAKDPNLIRFVGRTAYLLKLWTWLTERHTPVKVLTALGGTGKTAIAYEFSRLLLPGFPASMAKVIWLTAKKQVYSPVLGKWVRVTRTDFESVDGFLAALAKEVGATEEGREAQDRDELRDLVLFGLRMFPSLVVVDDIDSLPLEQQGDLFSTVQILAGRSFDGGSRFLLTSRLELSAGDDQRLVVKGFEEEEFSEYAKMTASERGITLDDGVIHRLHKASLGSPVFCASIIRLVSLGTDINNAITQWKDRAGEDVRKFAFERELDQLTDSQARTLFALSALGETTQLELKQVLNVDDDQITRDLARLREYHLFASRGDPSTGTKLEVPEPIRLMSDILRRRLADPVRVEKECARARSQVPKVHDKVANAIAGILALWKADDYDAALLSAQQAGKANPKSGDLQCVLGQSYLKVSPAKPEDADKAFRKAYEAGCARPELIPNWLEAKRLTRDWNGIVDVAARVPPSELRGRAAVIVLDARLELAKQLLGRGDPRGQDHMREAMFAASKTISQGRAAEMIADVRERCRTAAHHYVHTTDTLNKRGGDRLDVFNAVVDAFRCHVTETWMIDLALESLGQWATDVAKRKNEDGGALDILERRLADLHEIRAHIQSVPVPRRQLLARIETVADALEQHFGLPHFRSSPELRNPRSGRA